MGYFHALKKVNSTENSPRATSGSFPAIKTLYQRLRYLYKHNHHVLSTWEVTFVTSVGKQLKQGIALTERQEKKVRDLLKKFKVSPLDSASAKE